MKRTRRCDARCHNAKGKRCTCICGGRYHGIMQKTDRLLFDDIEAEKLRKPSNAEADQFVEEFKARIKAEGIEELKKNTGEHSSE